MVEKREQEERIENSGSAANENQVVKSGTIYSK